MSKRPASRQGWREPAIVQNSRAAPLQKGVRRRVVRRCRRQRRQGGAGGGRTARSARLSIRKDDHASGAALGAAVVHAVLDLCVTRQAHKVCQARRVARPAAARAGGAVVRVREVRLKIVEADRARRECRRGGVGDTRKLWGEHGRRPCHISVASPLGQRECPRTPDVAPVRAPTNHPHAAAPAFSRG